DKKEIYITVNVKEGDVFMLEKVKLAGNLIVDPEELIKLVGIGPGEVFSRKQATETSKSISDRLGDEGYVFANVNMVPDINNENKTVDMTFFVDPGKRYYVRNINMKGNTKTRDEVLRREMRQMESSWAATSKIDRSKVRLDRLGYFEPGVNVETPPVVGSSDQIDVNYTVVEKASGNLMAGVGFSQTQGIIFNANVSQDNIFGSGKRVDFSFNNSEVSTVYRFGYYNPYFTLDGVSLGYNLGYTETDARKANTSNYSLNVGNAGTSLGIPLNEYDSIHFNADYKYTSVNTNTRIGTDSMGNPVFLPSKEVFDFVQEEGDAYHTFSLSVGWTHDTLDRAIFPTSGRQQRLSALATVPGSDLTYYKLSYKQQNYFPLAKDLTLRLHGEVAYGDGYGDTEDLPFFEHYFAGGVRSVRGFQDNTIGPRDSRNRPFGGSTKAIGNVELLFPVPFFKENKSLRMGTFVDAGSISDGLDLSNFRYSVGISGEWLSPFGALAVSIAQPINADSDDKEQNFQFSFGSNF
ncbi:MAG: outer membrane protein assembly factor BamA, partial [Gammaproteobacteria bacterium]